MLTCMYFGEVMVKANNRKRCTFVIHLDPRNAIEFDGVVMDFNNQKILGVKNGVHYPLIGETRIEYKRKRDNKEPKILHASSSVDGNAWLSANRQLMGYEHLIAVDTNTKTVNGSKVSITAAYHVIPQASGVEYAYCKARVLALIECWNVEVPPENLGWWQILNAISEYPGFFSGQIGLIVDSDLGNHEAFNKRTLPIVGDYYLPENVAIIYGSDQGGAEHLSTKMIKYCDALASDLMKNQNLTVNIENLHKGINGLYSHIRQWNPEKIQIRRFC